MEEAVQQQEMSGKPAILVVAPPIRTWLSRLMRTSMPTLAVLAYSEIPDNKQIRVVASVGQ
mgnify:FL=1